MRPFNILQRDPAEAVPANASGDEGWEAVLEVPSKAEEQTIVSFDVTSDSSHEQRDDRVDYKGSRDDLSETVGESGEDQIESEPVFFRDDDVRCVESNDKEGDEHAKTFDVAPDVAPECLEVLSETTPKAANTANLMNHFLADQLSDTDKSDEEATTVGCESDCEHIPSTDEHGPDEFEEEGDPPSTPKGEVLETDASFPAEEIIQVEYNKEDDSPTAAEGQALEVDTSRRAEENNQVECNKEDDASSAFLPAEENVLVECNKEDDSPSTAKGQVLEVDTSRPSEIENEMVASCGAAILKNISDSIPFDEDSSETAAARPPLFDPIFFGEFSGTEDEETRDQSSPRLIDAVDEACDTREEISVTHVSPVSPRARNTPTVVELNVINGILDLIQKQKWAELVELLETFPSVASVAMSAGSSYLSSGDRGNLILHEVCKNDPPLTVVTALLKAFEGAARTRGQWGYLPMHYACTSGASGAVIEKLMQANPAAAMGKDCNGMLPLHLACKWGAPETVLMPLLTAYPDGALARDNFGKFPLEYAMANVSLDVRSTAITCLNRGPSLADARKAATRAPKPTPEEPQRDHAKSVAMMESSCDAEHRMALEEKKAIAEANELIAKRRWEKLVQTIKACPKLASATLSGGSSMFSYGSQGNFLLHEVCKNDPPLEVLEVVVEANVDVVKTKGQWGYLPLHYACTSGASAEAVQFLIGSYPEGTRTMDDNDQMLPLHLACKWGASKDTLLALLESNPEATTALDAYGKTPMDYATSLSSASGRAIAIAILDGSMFPSEETESTTVVFCDEKMPDPHLYLEGGDAKSDNLAQGFDDLAASLQQELSNEVTKTFDLGTSMDEQQSAFKVLLQSDQDCTVVTEEIRDFKPESDDEAAKLKRLDLQYNDLEEGLAQDLAQGRAFEAAKDTKEGICSALLESELMLQSQASMESLLYQPSHDLAEWVTAGEIEANLEAEKQRIAAMEDGLGQMQALLLSGRNKLDSFEHKQHEEQAILESAKSKVAALEQTQAEKDQILASARAKLETLMAKKVEKQAMLEAERKKVEALDKTQSEMQAILDEERESIKGLERNLTQTQEVLDELESLDQSEDTEETFFECVQEKAKSLTQSLEVNKELLEAEQAKVKRHELTIALQQDLLESEQKKITDLEASQTALQNALLMEQEAVQELANAQAEKRALLEADQKIVQALEESHTEKKNLLESEKAKMKEIEDILAEQESLLASEQEKVKELEQTIAKKQMLLELEQKTVITLEHTIAQKDALLEMEKEKVQKLEVVQAEKRALLECEEEMVHAIAGKHAEKTALLQSEELVADDLQKKKRETEALLESEERIVQELEHRQAQSKALLAEEQEMVKALQQTRAQRELLEGTSTGESKERNQSSEVHRRHTETEALLEEEVAMAKALERTQVEKQALEVARAEKQALLESEQEMLRAIATMHAEKTALLESEELVADSLEKKKKETEALLESEQIMAQELERRQAKRKALLEAEHEMVQALKQTRAEKHTLLDTTPGAYESRLVVSQKSALLTIAKQKAGVLLRSTLTAPRFFQDILLASATPAKQASSAILNASSRMIKKPLENFVVYCNGLIGMKSRHAGGQKK
jgi:ankyrin repeat protein